MLYSDYFLLLTPGVFDSWGREVLEQDSLGLWSELGVLTHHPLHYALHLLGVVSHGHHGLSLTYVIAKSD